MATLICPNCHTDGFTLRQDNHLASLLLWWCNRCFYRACATEPAKGICPECQHETRLKLEDETKKYWWCSVCDTKTEAE